jgi:hypothetical protein
MVRRRESAVSNHEAATNRQTQRGFRSSGWPIRIRAPSRTLSQNSK